MKNADLPSMPTQKYDYSAAMNGIGASVTDQFGLTKREHFAAMAMQGLLSGNSIEDLAKWAQLNNCGSTHDMIKIFSEALADKMLAEDGQ